MDGTNFTPINTVGRNVTTYMDTGLAAATMYFYRVRATNQVGDSANSNIASARTKIAPPVLQLTDICGGQINLAWSATADDHYDIERSLDGNNFTPVATVDASVTSFSDSGLSPGTYFYRVRAFNADGDSTLSNKAIVTIGPVHIDHSSGFANHDDLTANGNALLSGPVARLTDAVQGQRGTFFSNERLGIRNFTTTFTFRIHEGTFPRADGLAFIIQSNSPTALGGAGGALAYFPIPNSVAVKFDLFKDGGNSTGLYTGGHFPGTPVPGSGDVLVSLNGTGIDLRNQDPKKVVLTYDGATLTETITDVSTMATFTTSYTVDIRSKVSSDSAFVGFGGGTGGLTAIQDVLSWKFDSNENNLPPRAPDSPQVTSVDRHDHDRSNISIAWRCHNSFTAQGYRIERSTDGINFTQIATVDVTATSFTDRRLEGGTYIYRVRSFDNVERISAPLNVASVVIGGGDNPAAFDHSAGFAIHGDITANGSASFTGTRARLTSDRIGEDGSMFIAFNSGVGISNFTTTFTFQVTPGFTFPNLADGFTLTIQGNNPTALGGDGGRLGYGGFGNEGIHNSIAVKFDLFKDAGTSTGLYSDGHFPGTPAPGSGDVLVSLQGTGIDLKNQNPKKVVLTYDGTTLTETIMDLSTMATFTTSYVVDIPTKVVPLSGNLLYVGFTGATGGFTAIQDILTWTFQQSSSEE